MSTLDPKTSADPSMEKQIISYLKNHNRFFCEHPELLMELNFPHETGGAISLVERQIQQLRERNAELKAQMDALLVNARQNDLLLEKIQDFLLSLISANSLEELLKLVDLGIRERFQIDLCRFYQMGKPHPELPIVQLSKAAEVEVRAYLGSGTVVCGRLPNELAPALLGDQLETIKSSALIYLNSHQCRAVLLLGSQDIHHFHPEMSTSFLRYLATAITVLLTRFVAS